MNKYGNRHCAMYRDLRDLLARSDIDAVLIATGPNWHATASILAANAGKDMYCEKPCTKNIAQSLALAETIRRTARASRCGTQRRQLCRILRSPASSARPESSANSTRVYAHPAADDRHDERLGLPRNRRRPKSSWIRTCTLGRQPGARIMRPCSTVSISKKGAAWSAVACSNGVRIAWTSANGRTTPIGRRRSSTIRPSMVVWSPVMPTA